jgi:hypothetical protein
VDRKGGVGSFPGAAWQASKEKPGFTLGVRCGDDCYSSSDRGDCFNMIVVVESYRVESYIS